MMPLWNLWHGFWQEWKNTVTSISRRKRERWMILRELCATLWQVSRHPSYSVRWMNYPTTIIRDSWQEPTEQQDVWKPMDRKPQIMVSTLGFSGKQLLFRWHGRAHRRFIMGMRQACVDSPILITAEPIHGEKKMWCLWIFTGIWSAFIRKMKPYAPVP